MRGRRGQAAVEWIIVWSAVVLPLTFMLIFTAQMLWTFHSVAEWTRIGARYAATHCFQNGANVQEFMRTVVPANPEIEQFRQGPAEIQVTYYSRNAESGQLEEFSCDAECSRECVPDAVRVAVVNYEYRPFMTYLGLPPVQLPDLSTAVPMESAGCDPETGECLP